MNSLVYVSRNPQSMTSAVSRLVVLIGLAWFVSVTALALADRFNAAAGERPLLILLAVFMPVAIYGIAYYRISAFREWVLGIDMRLLILLHSWRMVGMGFVFLYFYDRLPALFALTAGLGDAMTAMAALFIGTALYQQGASVSRQRILLWNSFGLIDFVAAVSLGVMTRSGEALHTAGQVSSDIMGTFPLALIPGFAVPFYLITHLIIYAQLRRREG
ncbi:MAG: hypothetical protein JSW45_01705 [Thiotrichales bacterium]|nr:MAG: hypothetical protein JSW45_01705 [Thiotrichales bacterium]